MSNNQPKSEEELLKMGYTKETIESIQRGLEDSAAGNVSELDENFWNILDPKTPRKEILEHFNKSTDEFDELYKKLAE